MATVKELGPAKKLIKDIPVNLSGQNLIFGQFDFLQGSSIEYLTELQSDQMSKRENIKILHMF